MSKPTTVVPGFSVLEFRALNTSNQTWVYVIDFPGFRAPFCGDGQSTLNPGTTTSHFSGAVRYPSR